MSSVEGLAYQIARAIAMVSNVQNGIEQARNELEEAGQLWQSSTYGSSAAEVADLPGEVGSGIDQLSVLTGMIEETKQALQRYLGQLGADMPVTTSTAPAAGKRHSAEDSVHGDAAGRRRSVPPLERRIADYRRRLDHPWPYGRPLRGWRISSENANRDEELASGTKRSTGEVDPGYRAAVERAEQLGLARGGFVPDIARHIEIKEASTMHENETRTIVLGKEPCGIDPVTNVSCHRFLRHFLPAGAKLVVYGPVGDAYVYEGKRTS